MARHRTEGWEDAATGETETGAEREGGVSIERGEVVSAQKNKK